MRIKAISSALEALIRDGVLPGKNEADVGTLAEKILVPGEEREAVMGSIQRTVSSEAVGLHPDLPKTLGVFLEALDLDSAGGDLVTVVVEEGGSSSRRVYPRDCLPGVENHTLLIRSPRTLEERQREWMFQLLRDQPLVPTPSSKEDWMSVERLAQEQGLMHAYFWECPDITLAEAAKRDPSFYDYVALKFGYKSLASLRREDEPVEEMLLRTARPLSKGNFESFCHLIAANKVPYQTLFLSGTGEKVCVTEEQVLLLVKALKTNRSVRSLYLAFNELGDQSAAALAALLSANSSLEELFLAGNQITGEGAVVLFKELVGNQHLRHLNVALNPIGSGASEALGELLKGNNALEELDVMDCDLSIEGQIPPGVNIITKGPWER